MSTRKVVLFDTQYAPAVDTVMYTVTGEGVVTTIDKMVAYNADSSNHTVTVRLVTPDGTPTGTDFVIQKRTLQPDETFLFPGIVGNVLDEGATINVQADAAGAVTIRGSGREDTQ